MSVSPLAMSEQPLSDAGDTDFQIAELGTDVSSLFGTDISTEEQIVPETLNDIAPPTNSIPLDIGSGTSTVPSLELIFIDSSVDDYETLVSDLRGREASDRELQVVVLDKARDGIEQLSDVLADHSGLDAVHLVSHGSNGRVSLGNTWLSAARLDGYSSEIAGWRDALGDDADLLIYGCDLASSQAGRTLSEVLGELCDCDVAASEDITGHASLGGDWDLEFVSGQIETQIAFSSIAQQEWLGSLGTITVTTTADQLDGDADTSSLEALALNPGSDGFVSLREAVKASNTDIGADTIFLQAGNYDVTISGTAPDQGDFDLYDDLSIVGVSPEATVVDALNASTLFDVHDDSPITVSFSDLRLQNGRSTVLGEEIGAALKIDGTTNTPNVFLNNVWFSGNHTVFFGGGKGGAIYNAANLTINGGLFEGNSADEGGAIYNTSTGTLAMVNVTIGGNTAFGNGAGMVNENGGTATLRHVTITDNTAAGLGTNFGGGILSLGLTGIEIANSIIADNSADVGNDISGTIESSGNNIIGDDTSASGFVGSDLRNVDPLLGALVDNGGDLRTYQPAALEAIDGANVAFAASLDQRGFLRNVGVADIGAHEVGASSTPTEGQLWLSTQNSVVSGGQTGDDSWKPSDLVEIGDPLLNLGAGTTSGTFATTFDAAGFAPGWDLTAAHFVSSDIQIGDTNFQLKAGDLLLSPKTSPLFTSNNIVSLDPGFQATLNADKKDLVVFRPDIVGDYSKGQFAMLLQDVAGGHDVRGITLIEQTTNVGGYSLQAGDFLYARSGPNDDHSIWLYETDTIGVGATPSNRLEFLDGDAVDVRIQEQIHGIELLEVATQIGGEVLTGGTLLLNVDAAEPVGSNDLDVDEFDIFSLTVSISSLVGPGDAAASPLFDGSDVGFDSSAEELDAIAVMTHVNVTATNAAPFVIDQSFNVNENSGNGTSVGTVAATDVDPEQGYTQLYWVDVETDEVRRISLDGSFNELLASQPDGTAATGTRGVAADGVGGKVYWTNNNSDEIWRADLNGDNAEPIVTGLNDPLGITVDANGGRIFWIERVTNEIWQADLDGSGPGMLISGLDTPQDLAVDSVSGKIYWTDSGTGEINRADLDGGNMQNVVSGATDPWGVALDLNAGKVYWSEPESNEIFKADMSVGATAEFVVNGANEARDLTLDVVNRIVYWTAASSDEIGAARYDGTPLPAVTGTGNWPTAIAMGPEISDLTFAITDGNTGGAFDIDAVSGEITVANSGTIDFEVTPVFNLTVEVTDSSGLADTALVTLTVNPLNDNSPSADDESFTVLEGGTATEADLVAGTSLLDGDTDLDLPNDTLTVNTTPVVDASHGLLTLNANGTFSYVHDGSENFTDSFTYEVVDALGNTDTATVLITITPDNDNIPIADAESFTVGFASTATEADLDVGTSLLDGDNDFDLPNDSLTINTTPVAGPSFGLLSLNANGTFSYTHDGSLNFSDSFTYEVADAVGNTSTAIVSITVSSGSSPVADTETFTVSEGGTATEVALDNGVSLLDGDTDPDLPGDLLTVDTTPVSGPSFGSLTIDPSGSFSYTHDGSENFADFFVYRVRDAAGNTDNATVTITITPDNDNSPVADSESLSVLEGGTATQADLVTGTSLLDGDTDVDLPNDTLTVNTTPVSGPSHGLLTLNANGTFSYAHDGSENFTDVFTYEVRDAVGNTATATVAVNVTPVNEPPTDIVPDSVSLADGTDTTGGYLLTLLTTTDPDDGEIFSYSIQPGADGPLFAVGGANGDELTLSAGVLEEVTKNIYTANLRVTDSGGNTRDETFTVNVTTVNSPPTNITPNSLMVNENLDTTGGVAISTLSATDPDPAETFTYSVQAGGDGNLFSIGGAGSDELIIDDGVLDFESKASYSINVRVTDSSMNTYDQSIALMVNDLNESPVAQDDTYAAAANSLLVNAPGVLKNDVDPEGAPITVSVVTPPSRGTLTLNADGSFSFTPDEGFFGTDVFVYQVDDGVTAPSQASVELMVPLLIANPPLSPMSSAANDNHDDGDSFDNDPISDPVTIETNSDDNVPAGRPTVHDRRSSGGSTNDPSNTIDVVFNKELNPTVTVLSVPTLTQQFERTMSNHRDLPARASTETLVAGFIPLPSLATAFIDGLNELRDDVESDQLINQAIVGSSLAVSASLSVGYVIWLIRGGVLLSSVLSSLPAWQMVDPLPVLGFLDDDEEPDTQDDSLETLVAKSNNAAEVQR